MNLKVGDLEETLAKRVEASYKGKLSSFTVSDDATVLYYNENPLSNPQFVLDQSASIAVSKFLKIPPAYYEKLSPDFRATLLRYELDRHKDIEAVAETLNGEIVSVHQPDQVMLPLTRVAEVVTKVFAPEDTIRRMITNDQRFHLDVTTSNHQVSFPSTTPQDTVGDSLVAAAVGDITEAGVRFLAYPFKTLAPSASVYAERLVCTNGQCIDETFSKVSLKGKNVDEVINELEEAAQLVLGELDIYLDKLGETREMYPPGSWQAFAQQLAREAKVKREVLDKVFDILNQQTTPVTVWDVNQAFTTVANQVEVYATMMRLQGLGGNLAFRAEQMIERCNTCERRL